MGLMDVIRKLGQGRKESKQKFKEMQEDAKLQHLLEERQKSSNQRELERYMKEQHEAEVKKQLDIIHKKQNRDNWKGNNILKQDTNILKNDRPILMEKNIFLDNKTKIPFKSEALFFKW